MEMLPTKRDDDDDFALHKLNDDCLLEIYKYLPLKCAKNLAATSSRLKHPFMFRYHKYTFELHSNMSTKRSKNGKFVIDNILSEYGPYIRSWSLTIDNKPKNEDFGFEVFKAVSECSTNLKRLEVHELYFELLIEQLFRECAEASACLGNVETLIFKRCGMLQSVPFLQSFRKLKYLHFDLSGTSSKDLQILFENNPDIESYTNIENDSFCGDSHNFDRFTGNEFGQCKFGPKFRELHLSAKCDCIDFGQMLQLAATNLTTLTICSDCYENLATFLTEMANRSNLKELVLTNQALDRDGWNAIQSFKTLKVLVVCCRYLSCSPSSPSVLDATYVWPPKLTYLRTNAEITTDGFHALVRQLRFITHLQLDSFCKGFQSLQRIFETQLRRRRLRRPTLQIRYEGGEATIEYAMSAIYHRCIPPFCAQSTRIQPLFIRDTVNINFSIPKCKKLMTFSY